MVESIIIGLCISSFVISDEKDNGSVSSKRRTNSYQIRHRCAPTDEIGGQQVDDEDQRIESWCFAAVPAVWLQKRSRSVKLVASSNFTPR